MNQRSNALAARLEEGASALATLAATLTDAQWQERMPEDGRKIGVIVHHVASMYPLEILLAQALAASKPIVSVTPSSVDELNEQHAKQNDSVSKEEALDLLARNSAAAAAAIRALKDEELDHAASISFNSGA